MPKAVFILSSFLALVFTSAAAKDKWQILTNKQVIFKGNSEQENTTVTINSSDFKRFDCLVIKYQSEKADTAWTRNFFIDDGSDTNIKTETINEQSGCVSVNASVIKEMMERKQPVFIYTTSLPKDPQLAARVRVRRVLLCKIEWN